MTSYKSRSLGLLAGSAALALIAASSIASAADLPVRYAPAAPIVAAPAFTWTGCYLGAHEGSVSARQGAAVVTDPGLNQFSPAVVDIDNDKFAGGGHVGCNYQLPGSGLVLGAEADISFVKLSQTEMFPNLDANGRLLSGGIAFSRDLDFLATARARIGYAVMPHFLAYLTGGVAFANNPRYTGLNNFDSCPNCGTASVDASSTGFTLGGGVEYAFTPNWLVRAEYLYYRFEGKTFDTFFQSFPSANSGTFTFDDLEIHNARIGVSYKF